MRLLLRQIRTERGVRQADLASKLGKPQSYVSKYEGGERRLTFTEVRRVCRALGIDFKSFVGRFEKQAPAG